ncbi:hypothetical protein BJX70DRAFT_8306 [Aspergillus crustosus]
MMAHRTAIVTGSARGIGKAIALRLVQDGYAVCVNDVESSRDVIAATLAEIKEQVPGAQVIGISADVTNSEEVEHMVKETVEQLGPLTLMVANAGIAQVKPLLDVKEEDIDKVLSVNVKGVFNCYTHAARQMISQGDPEKAARVGVYKILGAARSSHTSLFRPWGSTQPANGRCADLPKQWRWRWRRIKSRSMRTPLGSWIQRCGNISIVVWERSTGAKRERASDSIPTGLLHSGGRARLKMSLG